MAVEIKSFNEMLGTMIRKIIADTPLDDLRQGSVLLTILEAAATNDFENNAAILSVLELINLDSVRNNDLDARGADFGLKRTQAVKSSGFITITDSNILKRSASLFPIKPAPISGQTIVFVTDAADFDSSGSIIIGRGTTNFEGPISYTSIDDFGTFFGINLSSALQNDHLISEFVVDVQGTTDRLIPAQTTTIIPANNQSPEIRFRTLRDSVIPAGEESTDNIEVVAERAGTFSNAGVNTITTFEAEPFAGAQVTNPDAFTNGRDIESDEIFKNRIKSFANTLARGTRQAILSAIIGVSDVEEDKQVTSAVITEPVESGNSSIIFIDDGTGFEPSFSGQSVDSLLKGASGKEEFLQLANFPLTRPQVVNTFNGPFSIVDSSQLTVLIDGVEEVVTFTESNFANISAAATSEVAIVINDQAEKFRCRLTRNSLGLLIYPAEEKAETIQVITQTEESASPNANDILKFPANQFSDIRLYKNNDLLRRQEIAASVTTLPFNQWNIVTGGNLVIEVDGTPPQNRAFDLPDFGVGDFNILIVEDWVKVFNEKYAGITAESTATGAMKILSNKSGDTSEIAIVGGTYISNMFEGVDTESTGQTSDFELNRQNGNIRVLADIVEEDDVSAGIEDAKGNVLSLSASVSGTFALGTDGSSRPAEVIFVADADRVQTRAITISTATTVTISDEGSDTMRILVGDLNSIGAIQPGDFLYLTNRGDIDGTGLGTWLDIKSSGLYRVTRKGPHTTAGVDTFVEVKNDNIVTGSYTVQATEDMQAFFSDKYPQIWRGADLTVPASASIEEVVNSINDLIIGVKASIFKTNFVKVTTTTEEGGSIAIPVSVGNGRLLFESVTTQQEGNPSHIANKRTNTDLATHFERTLPTSVNVFLDRFVYSEKRGSIDTTVEPGIEGTDPFSEVITSTGVLTPALTAYDNILNFTFGNNRSLYKNINEILVGDSVGTQFTLPSTVFDHIATTDSFSLYKMLEISDLDNLVIIMDQDAVSKTSDLRMSRTGRVNSGSQAGAFPPTNTAFSADDVDNEPGVDFGTVQSWGKSLNDTEFKDYTLWFRGRNWYQTGGATSGGGAMLIRNRLYGPNGENTKFRLEYPTFPNATALVQHENVPEETLVSYFFGSGTARTIGSVAGMTFTVTDQGGTVFRYDFDNSPFTIDLSSVIVGDVVSMQDDSGVSAVNRGRFSIAAVNDTLKTFDVYNPDGVDTVPGLPEITDVTTVDDIVGSPEITDVTTVADVAASLDGTFHILQDSAGSVAIWYDVDNTGTIEPAHGAARSLKVSTVNSNDSANQVALASNAVIAADSEFTTSLLLNVITVTDVNNGVRPAASAGTSGFTVVQNSAGTDDVSIDGLYFALQDKDGSVAFWFDVDDNGTLEPANTEDRSVEVTTITSGDTASVIAGKLATAISADLQFSATALGSVVTVTDAENGVRPAADPRTSGFTVVQNQAGVDDAVETILIPTLFQIFPLTGIAISDIVETINDDSSVVNAVAVGDDSLEIKLATRDEVYTPAGVGDFSVSLSFGHDPDPLNNLNDKISLFDSESWVRKFSNDNPNFTLKQEFVLEGVAPSVYRTDTAPDPDVTELGERFKLVPRSIDNIKHQLTQKALSQLSIIAEVEEASLFTKLQLKSAQLGSTGAIEVVGGRANDVSFSVLGDSQAITSLGIDYIETRINSSPNSFNKGDHVLLTSVSGTRRRSRLTIDDTIDVIKINDDDREYRFNPKDTFLSEFVRFDITDVSATYGRPAGVIWRWMHSDSGSFVVITDKALGAPGNPPDDEIAAGGSDAAALEVEILDAGTGSTNQQFRLTVSALPTQADYFTFESSTGNTYAVNFDVDAAGTLPAGASFVAATNKIEVDILSGDSDNDIVVKLFTALGGNVNFVADFTNSLTSNATFDDVVAGDVITAFGSFVGWDQGNLARASGVNNFAGNPIIAVSVPGKWVDVVNPDGKVMVNTAIGASGNVIITPTPFVKWNLAHSARVPVTTTSVTASVATANTSSQHKLNIGDTFDILNTSVNPTVPGAGIGTVISVSNFNTFTYATSAADGFFSGGSILNTSRTVTKYRIVEQNFNDIVKLERVNGDSPRFFDCGMAVDDVIIIKGSTFKASNTGEFRVLGVENNSLLLQNENAIDELNTIRPFNNTQTGLTWTANSVNVQGVVGSFENLSIGDWVKKIEDDDTRFLQVLAFNTGLASTAIEITLGKEYAGVSSVSQGVAFDQTNDVNGGVILLEVDDIEVLEGDATRVPDNIIITERTDANWFDATNSGTHVIISLGTQAVDFRPFLRVENPNGNEQLNVALSVDTAGFFILEDDSNKFRTIKRIAHIAPDDINSERRTMWLTPGDRVNKFSESNRSKVQGIGKIGFTEDIVTGIDGYLFYTGLLRTVQRVVDGFEPDPDSFPGRKAIGGFIELLPPLPKRITLSIDVTTDEGVNLNEITNEIKTIIINYVDNLGVGEDVILSEIIARVMSVSGVGAITFIVPSPETERIAVSDEEKALIASRDISIS